MTDYNGSVIAIKCDYWWSI